MKDGIRRAALKTGSQRSRKDQKGNLTIYAKWKANKYTVRFHGNKATSGSMQEMKNLEYDMDYTLRKNKFKRKGYKFVRWNTKADGSGKKYGNKEEIENLSAKKRCSC